jgi:hypothetical protein
MISNKKQLLLGVALGTLGISLYNSIKDYREKLKYMEKEVSKQSINTANLSKSSTDHNDIMGCFNELKQQANLLQSRLDELKN